MALVALTLVQSLPNARPMSCRAISRSAMPLRFLVQHEARRRVVPQKRCGSQVAAVCKRLTLFVALTSLRGTRLRKGAASRLARW